MAPNSPPTGINPGADRPLSLDVAFDVLAEPRRRAVLAVLDRRPGPLPLDTVVEAVVETTGGQHRRTAAALHHVHLPKLGAAGLVAYDRDARTVAADADFAAVRPLLAVAREGRAGGH